MIEGQEGVSWAEWLALATACEDGGLEGLHRSDHYLSVQGQEQRGSLDAWATLAALAARTGRIRLGTLVSPATFRHPSELAKLAATCDHVSGGRVELGIGAGWNEREHQAYGFPFHDLTTRLDLFAEQLEIIHRQWTEEVFSHAGKHYVLDDCRALPKPLQRPHPPLIVGGAARRGTVEPAVRFADEYNTVWASPDQCRERRARVVEACERAGRDPATMTFSLATTLIIGSDRAEFRERTRRVMARLGEQGDPEAFLAGWSEDGIAGTPAEVVERLRLYEDAGVERVFLQHFDHSDLEAVGLLAAEVVPVIA